MKMNPVVHFEMPADDMKRMTKFYSEVFGWKTEQMGNDYGNYVVVSTTPAGEDSRPKEPGAINGGFYAKAKDNPGKHPSLVISVDNIDEHVKKVKEAGGKIVTEPTDIPGIGKFASFVDTEGNMLSMLQPSSMM